MVTSQCSSGIKFFSECRIFSKKGFYILVLKPLIHTIFLHLYFMLCRFIYVSNIGAREIAVYEKSKDGTLDYIQVLTPTFVISKHVLRHVCILRLVLL